MRKGQDVIGLYLRCSTTKQDLRMQRHSLTKYCKEQLYPQHEIITYADDGLSGKSTDRPALKKMMKDAANGQFNRVVVFELSRLSRNMMDLLNIMNQLNGMNIQVETPVDGPILFDGTMQQFLVAAKSLVAAEEREHISRRTREALAERKAAGVKLGAKVGDQRRLGIRKDYLADEPELVEKIKQMRKRKRSTHEIASVLDASQSKIFRIIRRLNL